MLNDESYGSSFSFILRLCMKKIVFTSFTIVSLFVFLEVSLFSYNYNQNSQNYQYNQSSPYNQNSSDPSRFAYPNRTDREKLLTLQIEKALLDDVLIAPYASSIQVYTIGHEVTLTGLINSDRIKLRAENKAKNTLGVQKVINNINVEKTK